MNDFKKPMLAGNYTKVKRKVFPAYCQPKLDGVRCLFNGRTAWTRGLKEHKPHIAEWLKGTWIGDDADDQFTWDGELMLPAPYTFQQTISAVKKDGELSHLLQYHIYDYWHENAKDSLQTTRSGVLTAFRKSTSVDRVFSVPTVQVEDEEHLYIMLDKYLDAGYEGAMYRAKDGVYKHGRSTNLLKLKVMQDAEFKIIGYEEGTGKDTATPVWVCEVDDRTFKCRPTGTYPERRAAWANREAIVGRLMTVQFQEYTDGGVPRFPVGLAIRDYE